jgi:dTDP-4-dehydrorhamnose 3,5-epimerase
MKILEIRSLSIPDIKIIRFGRFCDDRGYFTEPFRRSDLHGHIDAACLRDVDFPQMNESWSKAGVVRGLHFQWNPYMGKLVRTVSGRMVDMVLDIRKGSATLGKMIAYDMPGPAGRDWSEWIWVPPGFAHGNFFTEPTYIEYLCSGEYSPGCEAGISPLSADLDWSLCDPGLRSLFLQRIGGAAVLSEKDRKGFSLRDWLADPRSENFRRECL